MNSNAFSTLEIYAIIAIAVIAVLISGLFFGGSAVESTGGYVVNSTNGSFLLGWATPIGVSMVAIGKSWVTTAVTVTYTLVGLGVIALAILLNR
jgi:hypothetical protein